MMLLRGTALALRRYSTAASSSSSSAAAASASAALSSERPRRFARLPLILQDSVLFPGTKVSMQIVEPRYQIMMEDVLKQPVPAFGHVMRVPKQPIPADAAVLPSSRLQLSTDWNGADVGTEAVIRASKQLPDGRLNIDIEGTRRFRILHQERNLFGAYEAEVEFLDEARDDQSATASSSSSSLAPSSEDGSASSGAAVPGSSTAQRLAIEASELFHKCLEMPYDAPGDVPIINKALLDELRSAIKRGDGMTDFSFKLAALLPSMPAYRLELLASESTEARLRKQVGFLREMLRTLDQQATAGLPSASAALKDAAANSSDPQPTPSSASSSK